MNIYRVVDLMHLICWWSIWFAGIINSPTLPHSFLCSTLPKKTLLPLVSIRSSSMTSFQEHDKIPFYCLRKSRELLAFRHVIQENFTMVKPFHRNLKIFSNRTMLELNAGEMSSLKFCVIGGVRSYIECIAGSKMKLWRGNVKKGQMGKRGDHLGVTISKECLGDECDLSVDKRVRFSLLVSLHLLLWLEINEKVRTKKSQRCEEYKNNIVLRRYRSRFEIRKLEVRFSSMRFIAPLLYFRLCYIFFWVKKEQ